MYLLDFTAFLCFILASLLGIRRAWLAFNLENLSVGKSEIPLFKYFINYIDHSVIWIEPILEKYNDPVLEKKRKQHNRLTYLIYILLVLAIGWYVIRLILQ